MMKLEVAKTLNVNREPLNEIEKRLTSHTTNALCHFER